MRMLDLAAPIGMAVAVHGFVAVLAAWPLVAAFLCAAIPLAVLACVYVCGDERGFLCGSYLARLDEERMRMQRARPEPPMRSDWKDDGM